MKALKIFYKLLVGGLLCGVGIVFLVCFFLGVLILSIYFMLMSWVEFPFFDPPALENPLDLKVLTTFCGVLMLFVILGGLYMIIEQHLNPTRGSFPRLPPSLTPCKQSTPEKKSKPILG